MTEITFKEKEPETLRCGDWVMVDNTALCVIAQITGSKLQLFQIEAEDANRWADYGVLPVKSTLDSISHENMMVLTSNKKYRKVNVSITVSS